MTLRIEAGLALIDVEWQDARLAFSEADCVTPKELGFGWMLRGVRDGSRRFVGSEAIRRELVDGHVALADDRHRRRLGGLGPAVPLRRPVPAEVGAPAALRVDGARRRRRRGRLLHVVRLLAGAAAAHRHRPGPARPGGGRAPTCGSSWPSRTTTRRCGSRTTTMPFFDPGEEEGLMSSHEYDAIVVGGGHNGLTHAAYLGKAGLRTLVLEKNAMVGGAAITEELMPGFSFTTFSYALSLLRPEIIHELDLVQHGFLPLMMPSSFHPTGDGDYLLFGDDHAQNLQEIRRHSPRDADAYERYHRDLDRVCQVVQPLFDNPPPDVFGKDPEDAVDVKWLLDHLGGVDRKTMHDVVRLLTGSASDWLDDYFEHEAIKGYHASSSIIGSKVGPMSPGSGLVLLFHKLGEHDGHLGSWAFHKGGNGGFTQVLARAAQANGAEIRLGAAVVVGAHGRRPGRGRRARGRHRVPGAGRGLGARPAAYVPRPGRAARAAAGPGRQRAPDAVPRRLGQGQLRPRRAAGLPGAARHRRPLRRVPQHRPDDRVRRARLRRREVRLVLRAAVHRRRDPVGRRPGHGPARQARHVVLRAVRAVRAPRHRTGRPSGTASATRPRPSSSRTSRASATWSSTGRSSPRSTSRPAPA